MQGGIILNNGSGTSETSAIVSGGSAGSRVDEIRITSGPTTAPGTGILSIIANDGSTSYVIDEVTLNNTVNSVQTINYYPNLNLPSSSWSIRAQMRTAITSGGTVNMVVIGSNY